MNWQLKRVKTSELKEFPQNPRALTKKGLADLKKSITKFGLAEPLVCNTDLTICGGHGRLKVLQDLKIENVDCYIPERQLTEIEFKELNIRLNKNIAGEFDFDVLANFFELDNLKEWGFKEDEFGFLNDNQYTNKITAPVYEITSNTPSIDELINEDKTLFLIDKINKSSIKKEIKDFLIKAAYRHNRFYYGKIAEYYAHSNKEVQQLIEDSALVIIDFKKAIEFGYVVLQNELTKIIEKDLGDE